MMKNSSKEYMGRLAVCLLGVSMTCMAAAIFYLIDLGSDPFQVFAIAVHKSLGISYGQANMLLNTLIVIFFAFFKRAYVNVAMLFSIFVAGPCIDILKFLLSFVITAEFPLFLRVILGFVGCMILAAGCFLYLSSNLGTSPPDGVGMYIAEKLNRPYGKVRVFTDVFFMGVGILLGGKVGITTIFAVLLTGPCIAHLQKWWELRRSVVRG